MPKWEVRRVSGKGFLNDITIATYKDLDQFGVQDIKTVHNPRHIGKWEEFLDMDHLIPKAKANKVSDEDLNALPTSWQGEELATGVVYCVITEFDEKAAGEGGAPQAGASLKAAFQAKIEDKVVQAQGDRLFKAGGADAEARKNVASAERQEGGVWGARRKAPPR